MKSFRVRSLMVLLACTILSTGYALADNHGRERREHERRQEIRREIRAREAHRERVRERREIERRREQRERWERERHARWERERWEREHRARTKDKRPAGWDRGRKTGWGDRDVPPGQAKKIGYDPKHSGWRDPANRPDWHRPSGPAVHQVSAHRR